VNDPIDGAIAATDGGTVEVKLMQIQVTIGSTGRPLMMAVPVDLTMAELLEFATWVCNPEGLRSSLPQKPSPLVVARGIPQIGRPQ
jgi:hypothetical protein